MEVPSDKELDEILGAMNIPDIDFKTRDDVVKFLRDFRPDKKPIKRFFAWLIAFDLIPINFSNAQKEIHKLIAKYGQQASELLGDNYKQPLEALDPSESCVIDNDIKRSIFWFNDNCTNLKISEDLYQNAEVILHRILVLISLMDSDLSYTQGFDRFTMVMYSLALVWVQSCGLPLVFAECITFFGTHKMLQLVDMKSILDNPDQYEGFTILDQYAEQFAPSKYQILSSSGQSGLVYSIKWRLILFCDDHNLNEVLLIWDQFISRQTDSIDPFYWAALAFAHLDQVAFNSKEMPVESIVHYKNWNIKKLLTTAYEVDNNKYQANKKHTNHRLLIFVLLIVMLAIILYFITFKRNI